MTALVVLALVFAAAVGFTVLYWAKSSDSFPTKALSTPVIFAIGVAVAASVTVGLAGIFRVFEVLLK